MTQIGNRFSSIEQVAGQYLGKQVASGTSTTSAYNGTSFEQILSEKQAEATQSQEQQVSELKFSKHATTRLEDRNIDLSTEQMERLESGAAAAGEKGIKESLIMVDTLAFIVNISNHTVVTAMDQSEGDTNVFTNIDGAVIA